MKRYRGSCSAPSSGRIVQAGRSLLALLAAVALLALGAVAAPGRALAAGGAKVVFTAPIYAGQNNGNPEGPVGANVIVAGSGWTANSTVALTLADQQNDTAGDPGSACTNGTPAISIPGAQPAQADAAGNFVGVNLTWPSGAGTKGHAYWVCGAQGGASAKGVQAFTVLSASPPAVSIPNSTVMLGSMVTITGQNWLPGGSQAFAQKIDVLIAPCVACEPGGQNMISFTTVPAQSDGSFSVSLPLPTAAKVGDKLFASAQSEGDGTASVPQGTLTTGVATTANVTVIAQATPTFTPSPSPTNTPNPTATTPATATTGGSRTTTGTNTPANANNLLIVLLLALGGVLLLAAVVAIVLFARSRSPVPVAPGDGPPYGGSYYGQQANYPPAGGPRRSADPSRRSRVPDSSSTYQEYYDSPPPSAGRQPGGWPGNSPGPQDDNFGDSPTIGTNPPPRR